jgi:hypothetical protein
MFGVALPFRLAQKFPRHEKGTGGVISVVPAKIGTHLDFSHADNGSRLSPG